MHHHSKVDVVLMKAVTALKLTRLSLIRVPCKLLLSTLRYKLYLCFHLHINQRGVGGGKQMENKREVEIKGESGGGRRCERELQLKAQIVCRDNNSH